MSDKSPAPESIVKAVVTASGFTPCPDVLVKAYGRTTALVWGKIWRFSQMADGVCRASALRIADELGMTDKTLAAHISILESDGYIKDMTPDVRNRPHEYVDTGKLFIKISLDMSEGAGTEKFRSRYGKIPYEESTTNGSRAKSNAFAAYEANIAPLTPIIAETLKDAEAEYSEAWVVEAIALAVHFNKRGWRYIETILKRWKENGKDDGKGGKPEPTKAEALKKAGYDV